MTSAQAKLILTGEHSVVYGHPALVARINLDIQVSLTLSKHFQVAKKQHNPSAKYSTAQLQAFLAKAQTLHQQFQNGNQKALFKIKSLDPQALPLLAAAVFTKSYPQTQAYNVSIKSNIPSGSGLGSSAVVSTAVIKALFAVSKTKYKPDQLSAMVYQTEQFIHGNPSGIDNTAVVFGGVLEFIRKTHQFIHQPIQTQPITATLIHSGAPTESTGQMVSLVKQNLLKNPAKINQALTKMGELTDQFKPHLTKGHLPPDLIKQNHQLLVEIGVVGERAQKIIAELETIGAAAKICGAGGLETGSGIMLVVGERQKIVTYAQAKNLKHYQVKLGV